MPCSQNNQHVGTQSNQGNDILFIIYIAVVSIFLYACESWTLKKILAFENTRYRRRLLQVYYTIHSANVEIHMRVGEDICVACYWRPLKHKETCLSEYVRCKNSLYTNSRIISTVHQLVSTGTAINVYYTDIMES